MPDDDVTHVDIAVSNTAGALFEWDLVVSIIVIGAVFGVYTLLGFTSYGLRGWHQGHSAMILGHSACCHTNPELSLITFFLLQYTLQFVFNV